MTKEEHAKVLAALETCKTGGYRDIDGDWCKRQVFDEPAVAEAITIMRKEPEPISDAEILSQAKDSGLTRYVNRHMVGAASWGGMEVNLLTFARALLEKAR